MQARLRLAQPADAAGIAGLVQAVARAEPYCGLRADDVDAKVLADFLAVRPEDSGNGLCLVADGAGSVIANLLATHSPRPEERHVLTLSLCVDPGARRQGIARQMLEEGLHFARAHGYRRVEVAVLAENTPALALYRQAGFIEEGRRRERYRIGGNYVDEVFLAFSLEEEKH